MQVKKAGRGSQARVHKENARKLKRLLGHQLIADSLLKTAGENAAPVLGQMEGAVSDEEIARACKFKVSEVRAVLNKLHAQGITIYERTRDKETGWYYYKWSADVGAVESMLKDTELREKDALEERLRQERAHNLYICKTCVQEKYRFDVALDYLFKCPQCGGALDYHEPEIATPSKRPGRK